MRRLEPRAADAHPADVHTPRSTHRCRPTHPRLAPAYRTAWWLLILGMTLTGCARGCAAPPPGTDSAAEPNPTAPPARSPSEAAAAATAADAAPPGADQATEQPLAEPTGEWRVRPSEAGAYDVFGTLEAPALDARALDRALQPAHAALAALPGAPELWTMCEAGHARLLVRIAAARDAAVARRIAETGLRAAGVPGLGMLTLEVSARGARLRTALSVLSAAGRGAATRWAEEQAVPRARDLPKVDRVGIAGATRATREVFLLPPALQRYGISPRDLVERVTTLTRAEPPPRLPELLEQQRMTRSTHPQGASEDPTLGDLLTTGDGRGEDLPDAFTGKRAVTVVYAVGSAAQDDGSYGRAEQAALGRSLRERIGKGDEVFLHTLSAMRRFRLQARGEAAESMASLAGRIHRLLEAGAAHDALILGGRDGVPLAMLEPGGRTLTVWLAIAGPRADEVALHELIAAAGERWTVHALDDAYDAALGWLIGEDATAGVVVASRDAQATSSTMRALVERLGAVQDGTQLRSGPTPRPLRAAVRGLDRAVALEQGVDPVELALVSRLLHGRVRVGRVAEGVMHLSLPGGEMAARHGELPLKTKTGLLPLERLRRVADAPAETPVLRLGGWPALYAAVDTNGTETWVFADRVKEAAQRAVEPSATLLVRTLRSSDAPLSGPAGGAH